MSRRSGGGRRPFGYLADRVTLDEREAAALRGAASRVLAGEPVAAVARDWNRGGPATVSGVPWSPTTIRRILLSGRIAGWVERDQTLIERGDWTPIIELDEHLRLRAALGDGRGRARSYLLSGLLFCGHCGTRMAAKPVVENGRKRRRYSCLSDNGGCGQVGISADGLERHVVSSMATRSRKRPTRSRAAGPGSVAILETRLDQLAGMYADGEIGRAEWIRARAQITTRLVAARLELVVPPVATADDWEGLPFRIRRAMVARAIESVRIAPRAGGHRFDSDRVEIRWRP